MTPNEARLEEVGQLLDGLGRLESDLRTTAAQQLGQVEAGFYVGLSAQMSLLNIIRQQLDQRRSRINELIAGQQVAGMAMRKKPKLVEEEADEPQPA